MENQLDLSSVSALKSLNCEFNDLIELDLSPVSMLTHLNCGHNSLTDLDLSPVPKLTSLNCEFNDLTELDLSPVPALTSLNCMCFRSLQELDLSYVPALTSLACGIEWETGGYEIDLSAVPALANLTWRGTKRPLPDFTPVTAMRRLDVSSNGLNQLDLTPLRGLKSLKCRDNNIAGLDLSVVPTLTSLDCRWNRLTKLDLSPVPMLTILRCHGNPLKELDLSRTPDLKFLDCQRNQLTDLDLSHVPNLTHLYCSNRREHPSRRRQRPDLDNMSNRLITLDVRGNPHLRVLICDPSVRIIKHKWQVFREPTDAAPATDTNARQETITVDFERLASVWRRMEDKRDKLRHVFEEAKNAVEEHNTLLPAELVQSYEETNNLIDKQQEQVSAALLAARNGVTDKPTAPVEVPAALGQIIEEWSDAR